MNPSNKFCSDLGDPSIANYQIPMDLEGLIKAKESLTQQIKNLPNGSNEKNKLISESRAISQQIKELTGPKKVVPGVPPKTIISKQCLNCDKPYESSAKISDTGETLVAPVRSGPTVVFCPPCRKTRNNDLLELITPGENSQVNIAIYQNNVEAEGVLGSLKADIRLDLHKTLDTISETEKLHPNLSCCCISYVGRLTSTRIAARTDIISRIKAGQITFGALVFNRGSDKFPAEANCYTVDGSKAWFNRMLSLDSADVPLFIDDSDDHVLSVKTLGTVKSVQIRHNNSLLDLINKHI